MWHQCTLGLTNWKAVGLSREGLEGPGGQQADQEQAMFLKANSLPVWLH